MSAHARSPLLLGVDVGSSDCKTMLVGPDGGIAASASQPYPTHYPRAGWAEQDPQDWYSAACASIRACLDQVKAASERVRALAIDGPAHTVALLDAAGAVIRPSLHWSDLRSAPPSEALEARMGDRIYAITYSRVNPSWTLTQLLWLREHEPDTWSRLRAILVTKDYVRFRFTGEYVTDLYDAVGTQMFDVQTSAWSPELCDLLGFPRDRLPRICAPAEIVGALLPDAAADCGLLPGTPIVVGSGDSVVEAFGIGAVEAGDCIIKLGTAANVNLVTREPLPSKQSLTYPHVAPGRWITITATNAGASTMRWFRDTFCRLEVEQARTRGVSVYDLIDALSEGAPPGADGLIFHPYLMGERSPYWNPHLRGDFVGIGAHHNAHHFARAILEGVAYSILDCLEVVRSLGQPIERVSLIGGGAKSKLWRRIICDVLGIALSKPKVEDAAFGSALLASVGAGEFGSLSEAVDVCTRREELLLPDDVQHSRYQAYFEVYRDIVGDLAAHSARLTQIAACQSQHEQEDSP